MSNKERLKVDCGNNSSGNDISIKLSIGYDGLELPTINVFLVANVYM